MSNHDLSSRFDLISVFFCEFSFICFHLYSRFEFLLWDFKYIYLKISEENVKNRLQSPQLNSCGDGSGLLLWPISVCENVWVMNRAVPYQASPHWCCRRHMHMRVMQQLCRTTVFLRTAVFCSETVKLFLNTSVSRWARSFGTLKSLWPSWMSSMGWSFSGWCSPGAAGRVSPHGECLKEGVICWLWVWNWKKMQSWMSVGTSSAFGGVLSGVWSPSMWQSRRHNTVCWF